MHGPFYTYPRVLKYAATIAIPMTPAAQKHTDYIDPVSLSSSLGPGLTLNDHQRGSSGTVFANKA